MARELLTPSGSLFVQISDENLHHVRELLDGVFGSETPMAPRSLDAGGNGDEDDGYLVTFTTDTERDCSECLVLDAADISAGPIARIRLPERISSGTHSCWAPAAQIPSAR